MYIQRAFLENIGCIERLDLAFPLNQEAGWHVILGGPGSGKTTALRALALALMGRNDAGKAVPIPDAFLRNGAGTGLIDLQLVADPEYDELERSFDMRMDLGISTTFEANDHPTSRFVLSRSGDLVNVGIAMPDEIPQTDTQADPDDAFSQRFHYPHSISSIREFNGKGWFLAGFGANRRFDGGNAEHDDLERKFYWAKSTVSLFHDDSDYLHVEQWLKWMHQVKIEDGYQDFELVLQFVNDGDLLPSKVRVESASDEGVMFDLGNGQLVDLRDLDGEPGAILTLVFELFRELIVHFMEEPVFKNLEAGEVTIPISGVVFIDDADANLSAAVQSRLGTWLKQHFPRMQFIVTTSSEAVAVGADSVERL